MPASPPWARASPPYTQPQEGPLSPRASPTHKNAGETLGADNVCEDLSTVSGSRQTLEKLEPLAQCAQYLVCAQYLLWVRDCWYKQGMMQQALPWASADSEIPGRPLTRH